MNAGSGLTAHRAYKEWGPFIITVASAATGRDLSVTSKAPHPTSLRGPDDEDSNEGGKLFLQGL